MSKEYYWVVVVGTYTPVIVNEWFLLADIPSPIAALY
jgi:hypothetical protein